MKTGKKRLLALITALVLLLSGCTPSATAPEAEGAQETVIYATFYPIYALADMIVGDAPDVTLHCLVQPQDGCLRAYDLSDWDLYLLGYSADLVICGGRGLERFEARLQALSEQMGFPLVTALSGLTLYQDDVETNEESTHFEGANPHLYMSIDGAMAIAENLAAALSALDAVHADDYRTHLAETLARLEALKSQIYEQTSVFSGRKVAVLNETLVYVAQDYGLEIAATVIRESGERLYDRQLDDCLEALAQSGAKVVLLEMQAPQPFVQELEAAGYAVAKLNVLSTLGESDGAQGYFDAQLANASAVSEAFASIESEGGMP